MFWKLIGTLWVKSNVERNHKIFEPCHEKTNVILYRSNTNLAVQAQKTAEGWKFLFQKVKEFYYPKKENKGVDQLRSYCQADLRLCFCLCKMLVFL